MPRLIVVAGLIEGARNGSAGVHDTARVGGPGLFLVTRRPAGTHLAHAWELPGGKLEEGEAPEDGLRRELLEELGVRVEVGEIYAVGHHRYPDREILLMVYRCRLVSGVPRCVEVAELRWITAEALIDLPLPPADRAAQARLAGEGGRC